MDEWHILFNSYKFRNRAARHLLDRSMFFDRKTFVSATPIPREYWLTELQDLPEYRIEWPEADTVHVNSNKVQDPIAYMASLCKSRANKGGVDNYHIFLNSVEGIVRIIRLAGLRPEQCRIVCSQSNDDTKSKNQEKLGEFQIQSANDPVKLFNFYTSTCFEGQDIFDPVGRTFIVSEAYKDHTKMDIMTTLLQICGRVRDSKFKTEINQFYAQSDYKDVSFEEFKENIRRKIEEAEHDAALLNQLTDGGKEILNRYVRRFPYISVTKENQIVVDQNLANLEIVHYGVINGQYKTQCNMNAALTQAGLKVTNELDAYQADNELANTVSIERTPFKDIFEEYADIRSDQGMYNLRLFRASRIEIEKPLVKEAYEKLGPEKVRELKYHQGNIKRELTKQMHETLDSKIFLLLDALLPKQVALPKKEIADKLEMVYKGLKIQKKAKATDIKA